MPPLVLDTNILVAAAFEPASASARIVAAVRDGQLRIVWADATKRENERILRKIPPIEWERFAGLFNDEAGYEGDFDEAGVSYIPDPADRKFAALAEATGAVLVSNDNHLLQQRKRGKTPILTPSEFWNRYGGELS